MNVHAIPPRNSKPPKGGGTPTRVVYDVLVLGSQLAGVVAGALLVKRGYRVLHVDPDGLGGAYEHQGYQLPYSPALLPHVRRLPPADAALNELGIAVELYRTFDAAEHELQLLFPRNRLDLPPQGERRASELAREFPAGKDAILSALAAAQGRVDGTDAFFKAPLPFPPAGLLERWAVRKAASRLPAMNLGDPEAWSSIEGMPFGSAMGSLARFLTHLEDAEAGPLARLRPLAHTLEGPCRFPGGYEGLRDTMQHRLRDLGGDVLGGPQEPAEVEELIFDGRAFAGLKLAGHANVYRADCLIVGMDLSSLAWLIPPKAKKRGLSSLLESVRVRRHLFALNLVVREEGLPLGLKDLALIHPGDELHGPVLLEVVPARKGGKDVAGEKVLSVATLIPHSEHSNSDDRLRAIAARLEAVVADLAPFIGPYVLARSIPQLDARNLRGTRLVGHPLIELDASHTLGIGGVPHRTPCKNLFLASREVVPGLGLEGEFMAGNRAAALVQERLKKHDPLK